MQPLFNLTHPSIHSGFDDGLPQIPSNFATAYPQNHQLNLSNHSEQSKHSQNTTTTSHVTPPHHHNFTDPHNTNIEIPTTDLKPLITSNIYQNAPDTIDPDNIFTNSPTDPNDALQIYPSQPLISDTNTIFDENERWQSNFFSPGHEEIIGAWQTMFPLQPQTPQHSMSNKYISSPSPYKKARPAPLAIPQEQNTSNAHTNLTAKLKDIGLKQDVPFKTDDAAMGYHTSSAPATAHIQSSHAPPTSNTLPNLKQPSQYDVLGENMLFPNHSAILPLNTDNIIPYLPTSGATLSGYPTRVAMPIVPAAYQNIEPSYWQKHAQNPSRHRIQNSKSSYMMPYTPYCEPNSAPTQLPPRHYIKKQIANDHHDNNSNTNHNMNRMMRPQSASTVHATASNNNYDKAPPKGNHYAPPVVATPPTMVITITNRNANVFANNAIINVNNNNNNNNDNNNNNTPQRRTVKRKRGRPRKYKDDGTYINRGGARGLQTPPPKKRRVCKRSADRKNLEFIHYLKGDGTGPEMQIEDLSPQKRGANGPQAKGFQRGGLRFSNNKDENVIRIVGGRDKSYKRPPADHRAYSRIRIWKDRLGRQFYDCICNARKPVQDLNKIKSHVLGHDKIVWVCDICGREFFNNHLQLNAHMKTHKKREIKASEQPIIK